MGRRFIVTCSEHFSAEAHAELANHSPQWEELTPNVFLLTSPSEAIETSLAASVFWRHVVPVGFHESRQRGWRDMKLVSEKIAPLVNDIPQGAAFAVQTRIIAADLPWSAGEMNRAAAEAIVSRDYREDRRNPNWIISILVKGHELFIGCSSAKTNRSTWPGGECRYREEPEQVSRSEFKLLEARDVFQLPIRTPGRALDLGAAPGGWTRVLRLWGYSVDAVDPARPDDRLLADSGISWFREQSGEYLARRDLPHYDLIANDMRATALVSARLMVDASRVLKPDGFALMTIKCEEAASAPRLIQQARQILERGFVIAAVRHLFHNRLEVTAFLTPRRGAGS